ncbi:MAG: nitrophenyl compound nitroreductase subunit ArsF family protein [Patescibacteria group bacterium]|jgi:hypothetical protein
MKKIAVISFLLFSTGLILTGCGSENKTYYFDKDGNITTEKPAEFKEASAKGNIAAEVADKLEVYYFHATARCVSCKTIGQYVSETMNNTYGELLKSGRIDYREINIDLPENKDVARKFRASGSSLFINRIKDGQDNIEQDANVWRLLNNETQFKSYLENKINSYLGI